MRFSELLPSPSSHYQRRTAVKWPAGEWARPLSAAPAEAEPVLHTVSAASAAASAPDRPSAGAP